ncbi:lipocalin family protein [Cyclobacterium amurskyense]|uniref:lipocalin family protein n=1 Tax=Cyclobacterium amurskyense TaxID=320787 RepID=UPI0030D7584F
MKISKLIYSLLTGLIMMGLFSCATIPKGAEAVKPFDKEKYLGKWYEIARLDFKFERNLNNTTASYSLNDNGTIKVDNQGYNIKKEKWTQAIGKAKFVGDDDIAKLKVSFFGPFYSGYNVIAIDKEYKYALVAGESLKYLWILSRETVIPEDVKNEYLMMAEKIGYNTSELIWVEHTKQDLNTKTLASIMRKALI